MGVDRQQGGPGGAVDLVGPFDAPRDPHRRGVGQKRNCRVAGGQDKGRPDWLLAEELVHNSVLHPLHERFAEEADHGCVDPSRHQPEGVSSGDQVGRRRLSTSQADAARDAAAGSLE